MASSTANQAPSPTSQALPPSTSASADAEVKIAEIEQWTSFADRYAGIPSTSATAAEMLRTLNQHLSTRTTLLGSRPSEADISLWQALRKTVAEWTAERRTGERDGHHHIVRWMDYVQNSPTLAEYGLKVSEEGKVPIDVDQVLSVPKPVGGDAKSEKERKKKEKEQEKAAESSPSSDVKSLDPAEGGRKNDTLQALPRRMKPEKSVKAGNKASSSSKSDGPSAVSLSPALIDLRVGQILRAVNHPNADSLYVSTIACGDAPGTDNTSTEPDGRVVRTVCSGLNGLVPLDEMQGRKVVVVCNLKPVTMRGVKSAAMVLAASPRVPADADADAHHMGPVELVSPPAEAEAGERVYFEGWQGTPEPVLNPKKKVWETIQPGFTTTADLMVAFDAGNVPQLASDGQDGKERVAKLRTEKGGYCSVRSLPEAVVR
ncbi:MAG: G4 quadruplex nucleic acid binding protein [Phylliscum demangeonii]|nr:MAG: G4 quadruplex nucleic acid binding protein [Phylliscum demangeonii]